MTTNLETIKLNLDIQSLSCLDILNNQTAIYIKQEYGLQTNVAANDSPNLYKIYGADPFGKCVPGKSLFRGREKSSLANRIFLSQILSINLRNETRPFSMKVINHACKNYSKETLPSEFNTESRNFLQIDRDYRFPVFCFNRYLCKLSPRPKSSVYYTEEGGKQLFGYVEQPWYICSHGCDVSGPSGQLLYRIESRSAQPEFWCPSWSNGGQVTFSIKDGKGQVWIHSSQALGAVEKKTVNCQNRQEESYMSLIFPQGCTKQDKLLLLAACLNLEYVFFEKNKMDIKLRKNKQKKSTKKLTQTLDNANALHNTISKKVITN